jgi:hypothetical protein
MKFSCEDSENGLSLSWSGINHESGVTVHQKVRSERGAPYVQYVTFPNRIRVQVPRERDLTINLIKQ